jgi:hypothetical protein
MLWVVAQGVALGCSAGLARIAVLLGGFIEWEAI